MYIHFRKPISIVKNSHVFLDCENRTLATHNNTCTSWITQVLISPPRNPKQFLLSSRLMGSLQNQQRPSWGCLTPPTFSPMHSSCSSAGDSFHQDININWWLKILISFKVFYLLLWHVSKRFVAERMNLRYFLSLGMIFRCHCHRDSFWSGKKSRKKIFHSGISTWLFGFSYVVGIHSLWYLLFVQVGMIFEKKTGQRKISVKIL